MPKLSWEKALTESADPARARQVLDQLLVSPAGPVLRHASAEQMQIVAAILGGSQFLGGQLLARPEWVGEMLSPDLLAQPRQTQGLRRDLLRLLRTADATKGHRSDLDQVRFFKQREMLRIGARDLTRLGTTEEIMREVSDVADICLQSVTEILWRAMAERLGSPWHRTEKETWTSTEFCLLGLGKLGGQELNYSSDVDVIFVYTDEGYMFPAPPAKSDAGKGVSNHQFFSRLAKEIIVEASRLTDEGMLFRMDVNLRPEGTAGPLVRSLASYENYYAQWGQTWERMMLIKSRCIAGSEALATEFMESIQAFRYPRSLSTRILDEVAEMKGRIESETLRAGEMERNVKLGHGGIREVEFTVQMIQLLHAGRNPFLQSPQTLPALKNLARYNLLTRDEAADLTAAYLFLRDVEHRLQMEHNLQTHTIPTDRKGRERLAVLMGFGNLADFENQLQCHTATVRAVYDHILQSDSGTKFPGLPSGFKAQEEEWKRLLASRSFRDTEQAFRLLDLFVHGPGYVHVSARTVDLALELLPHFLAHCPARADDRLGLHNVPIEKQLSDPDRVLARLDSFIQAYGARAMLYETWTHHPSLFELLLLLFDRSEYLAEVAIRIPDLVDDLQLSGRLRRSKTADETLTDLRYGIKDEDQFLWLRSYHRAEQMRLGLRDILGLVDFEHNLTELSALAEACLQYATEVVQARHQLSEPPFVVMALGKLGGREINYGSDLDLIFVASDGVEDISSVQRHAIEIMELLSKPTSDGIVFPTDSRLRPDGEKGLLVNTLTAYDNYFRERAQLWEIQAFTRIRPVAGDLALGCAFQEMARRWTDFSQAHPPVAAYGADWKQRIARMRSRIEKERSSAGQETLAIKTGAGGLMDAEFIAQAIALENGWQEPNTLRCLERAMVEGRLPKTLAAGLIVNYRHLRRIEGILRRWSFAGETLLPDDPAALHRVALRCGFTETEGFNAAMQAYRKEIRSAFDLYFSPR